MKLTLIRHTSVACGSNVCYGQTDVDVSDTFEMEAQKVSIQLNDYSFDKVFSSPSQRCTKLASFCGLFHPVLEKRLMELNFGDWEGIPWNELADPNLENWYKDWINVRTTNGESFSDQLERVKNFLEELRAKPYEHVLIFTHAGVIRSVAILLGLVQIELAFTDYKVEYGEIKHFEI